MSVVFAFFFFLTSNPEFSMIYKEVGLFNSFFFLFWASTSSSHKTKPQINKEWPDVTAASNVLKLQVAHPYSLSYCTSQDLSVRWVFHDTQSGVLSMNNPAVQGLILVAQNRNETFRKILSFHCKIFTSQCCLGVNSFCCVGAIMVASRMWCSPLRTVALSVRIIAVVAATVGSTVFWWISYAAILAHPFLFS